MAASSVAAYGFPDVGDAFRTPGVLDGELLVLEAVPAPMATGNLRERLSSFVGRTGELRQLRELAYLVARYSSVVDWMEVKRRFSAAGHEQVLSEQLIYCQALLGVQCPIDERRKETAMDRLQMAVNNPTMTPSRVRTGWSGWPSRSRTPA